MERSEYGVGMGLRLGCMLHFWLCSRDDDVGRCGLVEG